MVSRLFGAAVRALLVVCLAVMPSLLIPGVAPDDALMVLVVALIAGALTLFEYASESPSLIEFRDAPPYNRLRFFLLFLTVLALTLIMRGEVEPNPFTSLLGALGTLVGQLLDFPYSPVRLVLLMMPAGTSPELLADIRTAAGLCYFTAMLSLGIFYVILRSYRWPSRNRSFNVFVNLPTFDPTAGGDVVEQLYRGARLNLMVGFLLPFVIPACVKVAANVVNPVSLENPQTLIWMMTAWAFLSASLMMRGIAMGRVGQMIEGMRKQRYAEIHEDDEAYA